jgi:glycosyltransferase involved in cell wall biosynthesis
LSIFALNSIPAQAVECIVVDNGSTDSTAEIAQRLGDYYLSDDTARISGVRNLGAKQARHEILLFLDADCLLPADFLTVAAQIFVDPLVGMTGSKTHALPETAGWVASTWKIHLDRSQLDSEPTWLVTRALAVRRRAFNEVGGFDESIETCEDVSFGHAIKQRWKILSDSRLTPIHLDDPDSCLSFFRKEVWRAQNSVQISLQWIKQNPLLLLTKEGISLILPFYFLLASILLLLGFVSWLGSGSPLAWIFALLVFIAPIVLLSWDTSRKAKRPDAKFRLAGLYTLYISAKVVALFVHGNRGRPRRIV